MFSSQLVEPYIGELTIASFTDQILHLAQGGKDQSPDEILKLLWAGGADSDYKPRKRQLDIAQFLRGRVEPYVSGTLSADDFRAACRKEAANIAVEKVSDDATNIQQI
jgi:hypothetical protein